MGEEIMKQKRKAVIETCNVQIHLYLNIPWAFKWALLYKRVYIFLHIWKKTDQMSHVFSHMWNIDLIQIKQYYEKQFTLRVGHIQEGVDKRRKQRR
jgi:hypothetical protein